MKLLLTAFDPFGGEVVNPAQEAVRLIAQEIAGWTVVKVDVPTVFGASIRVAADAIERERPDAVLCVGQAGGRCGLTIERVAINVSDARIADNAGNQPIDEPVAADGPAAYFATLPIKAMAAAIRGTGLPASVSNTAGTFVCNHLMYGVLHLLAVRYPGVRGGFMHVPYTHAQAADRAALSMSVADIARGIEAAIIAIAQHHTDISSIEGSID